MFDVGDEIGPYKIVRRLGAGGMGEVFQGRHRHMHRDAAIKVLREELSTNAEVVRRFFTEARATAAVRHPAIIEIFDCDVHPRGSAYIVMELLEGEDLAQRLAARGSFIKDLPALREIARQVANGLGAAHELGIVHRDLKPGNIFLSGPADAPVVKILDFGIAKLLMGGAEGHERTQTGNVLGTPLYMSPEQARGARAVDHRADIYALACVMFEMLSGRPPFVDKSAAEVVVAHIFKAAPRVSSLVVGVPAALDALIAHMLEKEPAARPQTMKEVVARLDALAEPAAPKGARVATQLLGSGKAAAPPAVETPRAAPAVTAPSPALRAAKTEPSTEVRAVAASARDARQFTRAGTTTLGSSAGELATQGQGDDGDAPRGRRRWLGPAVGAGVVAAGALVLVLRGGPSATDVVPSAATPAPRAAIAAPPTAVRLEISSQPPGAELWIGRETTPRGRTPLSVELARGGSLPAQLRLPGRAPVDVVLDPAVTRPITVVFPKPSGASPPAEPHAHSKKSASGTGFKAIED